MAAQLTAWKLPAPARHAVELLRAKTSLPVPVSPRSEHESSVGAKRSSSAPIEVDLVAADERRATLAPGARRAIDAVDAVARVALGAGGDELEDRVADADLVVLREERSWTKRPSTIVPLRLPRSASSQPPWLGVRRAWRRETAVCAMASPPGGGSRPITTTSPRSGNAAGSASKPGA